jgi:uncharacterized membrane protein
MDEQALYKADDEDRILRVWTPLLLRSILIAASLILVAGLFLMATSAPGFYVQRYHAAQQAHFVERESFLTLISLAVHGNPHSLLTVGLFVLTLVPLARVAFCFLLFIREADYAYVGFTAYVLIGLIAGILLGRIG